MNKIRSIVLGLMLLGVVNAQEGLRPMTSNPNLIYKDLKHSDNKKQDHSAAKTTVGLSLPFFDDFSNANHSAYPSQQWWMDSTVYINTGMGRAPLSLGVATFDGLNKWGFPYSPNQIFNSTSAAYADTLTSQPINLLTAGSQTLQPSDSVALIFYYQQTGNGDSPEAQDSLMLDFYLVDQAVWESKVWALKGNLNPSGADTVFKRVFIWIDSTKYLKDGFKFRFRNKAQSNGNFDNWNIDHVFLDKGRSKLGDTAWNDVTIPYVPSSFLKSYSSMPWYQYNANPAKEMGTTYSNYIRYNGTSTVNTTYEYRLFDASNTQLNFISYGASNLPPFKIGGWQHNFVHSKPNITYTFAAMSDSADFTIKHYMQSLGGDISVANDTVYQRQRFRNYFAYDDGSCETGYYVAGTGGRLAVKYDLNVADTLRGIRIYFDPVGAISSYTNNTSLGSYKFKVNVYSDNSGYPSNTKLFTSDSIYPKYGQSGHNVYADYKFATPFIMSPGVCYIGIQQYVATGITIGFDKNYNSNTKLFYDSGFGWTQSSYYGSLMIRPLFGQKIDPPVGINENGNLSSFIVYPNPASDIVKISDDLECSYALHAMDGKLVLSGNGTEINTHDLSNGIYILTLSTQNLPTLPTGQAGKVQHRQKLIIQH